MNQVERKLKLCIGENYIRLGVTEDNYVLSEVKFLQQYRKWFIFKHSGVYC
jgi:hypothetical protein